MSETTSRRVLIVANRTGSTLRRLEVIEGRARDGCDFMLMVPPEHHPDAPDWTTSVALELVTRAALRRAVASVDCGAIAAATIGGLAEQRAYDEISSPRRLSITSGGAAKACRGVSSRWVSA